MGVMECRECKKNPNRPAHPNCGAQRCVDLREKEFIHPSLPGRLAMPQREWRMVPGTRRGTLRIGGDAPLEVYVVCKHWGGTGGPVERVATVQSIVAALGAKGTGLARWTKNVEGWDRPIDFVPAGESHPVRCYSIEVFMNLLNAIALDDAVEHQFEEGPL